MSHGNAPRWRIGTVLLWLILACLLPGIIGTAVLFTKQYLDFQHRQEQDIIATARAMVQSVDSQLFTAKATAQSIATYEGLKRNDLAGFHRWARKVIAKTGVGFNVVLCNRDGQQLVNTLQELDEPLPHYGNMKALHHVFETGQPEISEVYISELLDKPLISIDVPVISGDQVEYVISMGIMPSHFNNIISKQNFPSDWFSAIFDNHGTIVTRSHFPDKFIGKKGPEDFIGRINEAPEGSMTSITKDGIPILSFWSRSTVSNWSVGIGIANETLDHEQMSAMTWLALGMTLLLSLGLGLAWFVGKKISRSVRALTAPAIAMGKGEPISIPETEIQETADVAASISQASKLLEERVQELQAAHHIAGFGFWQWNLQTGQMIISNSIKEIYGREIPPFPEQRGTLMSIESWERLDAATKKIIQTGIGYDIVLQVYHRNGSTIWINQKCEATRNADGKVCELHGSVLDITERKLAELELEKAQQFHLQELEKQVAERTLALTEANKELEHLARTDALTGLQNRQSANEHLRQEFLRLKRSGSSYAVFFMDIDHFKKVNDTYGHETGDQVLQQLGNLLTTSLRQTDFVARFGGEEFLAILPDTGTDEALTIAEKIRSTVLNHTMPVVQKITISIGVTVALVEDKNEDEAVHRADSALYKAKAEGRNTVRFC